MKNSIGALGCLSLLAMAFLMTGCGSKDEAPAAGGPAVGSPTPGGGTITSTPVQGRKPRMHP